ncbi:carboxymuconolactone decarboxylase family protein [Robiginitalea biformata]|uniref:Carboxymuconolactone decarboxylase n=1 Tax=Robiginitalea biformata (strain ATCC BAA-864 / DSM 15991 / KCTC 12146 / HTCC2501) TaxID=313596 RepID=A4CGT4_ROBBH|nr:carboxymuconolactone decarboxylase family protein [Robiginitalea biformata]EAR16142.1 carboxymuconolactone decarboxylase [Robiginitalea biformata HTCC2501]
MSTTSDNLFPGSTRGLFNKQAALTPETSDAWRTFSQTVFKPGALDVRTKQLIALAVGHATRCPYCIRAHTAQALKAGASAKEISEAIWIAAEMSAGAASAHAAIAFDEMERQGYGENR